MLANNLKILLNERTKNMKKIKKLLTMVLAAIMVCAGGSLSVFAADTYTITIINTSSTSNISIKDETFSAYKIFDATTSNDIVTYTIDSKSGSETNPLFTEILKFMGGGAAVSVSNGVYSGKGMTLTPASSASTETKYTVAVGDSFVARDFAQAMHEYMTNKDNNITANATGNGYVITKETDPNLSDDGNYDGKHEKAVINITEAGYYLVTGEGNTADKVSVVAAAALDTVNKNIEMTVKASAPTIDKYIQDYPTTGGRGQYSEASIGDTIDFRLASTIPNMKGYAKYFYVVNDTLSKGLTIDASTIEIYIDKGGDYQKQLVKDTDYTVEVKYYSSTDDTTEISNFDATNSTLLASLDHTKLKIVFKNFIQYQTDDIDDNQPGDQNRVGQRITIDYDAALNTNAVVGKTGNPNTVNLTYSTNPNVTPIGSGDEPDTNDPTGKTPDSKTITYTTKIQLTKVNADSTQVLSGAKFQITGNGVKTTYVTTEKFEKLTSDPATTDTVYYKLTDGSYTTTDPNGSGVNTDKYVKNDDNGYDKYKMAVTRTAVTKSDSTNVTGTTGEDGILTFEGLGDGEYTITEIEAPTGGYVKLTKPIVINIKWSKDTTGEECTWSGQAIEAGDNMYVNVTSPNGVITFKVANSREGNLPDTGGIGTTIFYVVGSVLVVGALIILVTKKRMKNS